MKKEKKGGEGRAKEYEGGEKVELINQVYDEATIIRVIYVPYPNVKESKEVTFLRDVRAAWKPYVTPGIGVKKGRNS